VSVQLEAIVLKSFDYKDHHKIVKMISPSHGLISVLMPYANKKKSRYRTLAEPLTCVTIQVKVPTEQSGLYYLMHGDMTDAFYEVKCEVEKVMMFYEMAEVTIRADIEKYHLPFVYRTLKSVLEIAASDEIKFRWGVVIFKAKMLSAMGILPAVDGCVSCGKTTKIVTASVNEGGLICEACYAGSGIWMASELIPLWRACFKLPVDRLLTLDLAISELETLENWVLAYYESYSNIKFAKRLKI